MMSAVMTFLASWSVCQVFWSPLSSLMQLRRLSRIVSCGVYQGCLLGNQHCMTWPLHSFSKSVDPLSLPVLTSARDVITVGYKA